VEQTARVDDDQLLARAEQALTEIKVAQGLSEEHAAVLAALRIRLHGSDGGSLEDMLAAADDTPSTTLGLPARGSGAPLDQADPRRPVPRRAGLTSVSYRARRADA
jgi:hypothetical protein